MAGTTVVRQPGEGDAIWMLNSLYEVRASSDDTGGESVYVLEGRVRYHIGGDVHEGGPGTFFYVPAGIEENFEPADDSPVRLLVIYTPGGMDRFFEEAGEPAERREIPPPSAAPPDVERLPAIAQKHGMELRAPTQA